MEDEDGRVAVRADERGEGVVVRAGREVGRVADVAAYVVFLGVVLAMA